LSQNTQIVVEVSDSEWYSITALRLAIIGDNVHRSERRGRPKQNDRSILNGIYWVMRTQQPWRELPSCYPSFQTCHRRLMQWHQYGEFLRFNSNLAFHFLLIDWYDRAKFSHDELTKRLGDRMNPRSREDGIKWAVLASCDWALARGEKGRKRVSHQRREWRAFEEIGTAKPEGFEPEGPDLETENRRVEKLISSVFKRKH
jgi:transposase